MRVVQHPGPCRDVVDRAAHDADVLGVGQDDVGAEEVEGGIEDGALVRQVLDEAFEHLGPDIVLAHAKDVRVVDGAVHHVAAGTGVLDYQHYLALLRHIPVPLIVHGLAEAEVPRALAFLRGALAATQRQAPAEVR